MQSPLKEDGDRNPGRGLATDRTAASAAGDGELVAGAPDRTEGHSASSYCPVCSQRLESRRCKLVCAVCGYYMSCSDYY